MAAHRSIVHLLLIAALITPPASARAQTVAKPVAGTKAADTQAAGAAKSFQTGTKAFESGKTGDAVAALSAAIASGSLSNPDLAKALFYRGVAQRREKKPGAALSDLNAAVWLRDGLSATDKSVAEDHRQALLREVARVNGAAPEPAVAAAPAPVAPVAAAAPPAPLPWTAAAPETASPPVERAAVTSLPALPDTVSEPVASVAAVERQTIATMNAEPAPPEKPMPWQTASVEAVPAAEALPWSGATTAEMAPPTAAVAEVVTEPAKPVDVVAAIAPAADAAQGELASAGNATTAYLGSLFSGGGETAAPAQVEPQPVAVAATVPAIPPPATAMWTAQTDTSRIETAAISKPVETPTPAMPLWSAERKAEVSTAPAPAAPLKPVAVAAAPADPVKTAPDALTAPPSISAAPADAALPPSAALPGPFRLQVAAENSRDDAEKTLTRLTAEHGPSLRGREPVIEEPATGNVLFGTTGSAYRVSVGPFAQSAEAGRLCNILKPHGFECRVTEIAP
jgi:hypothetical protein